MDLRANRSTSANTQPGRVVQEEMFCAHSPGSPSPRQDTRFLISPLVLETTFASLGAFFSLVRSYGRAMPLPLLCQLVSSPPLHNNRDGISPHSQETTSYTMIPRHHDTIVDTTTPRYQDTMVSKTDEEILETVRKAVKHLGREPATQRLTIEEKQALRDIEYTYSSQNIQTSANEIIRIALNFILADYRLNGEKSFLATVLKKLNS